MSEITLLGPCCGGIWTMKQKFMGFNGLFMTFSLFSHLFRPRFVELSSLPLYSLSSSSFEFLLVSISILQQGFSGLETDFTLIIQYPCLLVVSSNVLPFCTIPLSYPFFISILMFLVARSIPLCSLFSQRCLGSISV